MSLLTEVQPTLENHWRAVILFGRNVASYKFALGQSLLELAPHGKEVVTLEDLADRSPVTSANTSRSPTNRPRHPQEFSVGCLLSDVQATRRVHAHANAPADRGD